MEFLVEFEVEALPLADWMQVTITPLAPHPNDPAPVTR
jgi:muconolactone delta-isomerase